MILLYVTTKNIAEAKSIGRSLVEERLAACVNILPKMHSIYSWKGKVESANEVVLLVKSTNRKYSKLEKRIKALHSYEVPCIIQIQIPKGSKQYLAWITSETK